tara:strand:+ start:1561 stop:2157 length:597 start_codon:yes stop_codon:yes gene_type:complete
MNSYSQMSQDKFANFLFKSKKGFFLDFGCGDGISTNNPCGNNTLLLEQNGWDGLSIDIDTRLTSIFKNYRNTSVESIDLTICDITELLNKYACPKVIDYFSFDIDGATQKVIRKFPFEKFEFKFITFEHDFYANGPEVKEEAFDLFSKHGYSRLINNVNLSPHGAVEDWYVKEKYFEDSSLYFLNDIEHSEILEKFND